jgi:hypothetical protein
MSENAVATGQLMDIGEVASLNVVKTLGLPEKSAPVIKQAIRDEISAMSSHFTLAVAELEDQFDAKIRDAQAEVKRIKSAFNYAKENPLVIWAFAATMFVAGFFLAKIL